ncbi:membrane lipoprotein lipid attachment site-containing protein [Sporosarcina jiandibaonis]|uniref:membrane lipoprotein lipid attachment site-containing protein n=1 Tax=Sporosarcina jiandibaonis TaxID=2715535 RepID=UPI0015555E88|nr:membrane lipoprotein lipid attachment site-containing protein [Sporosarcina jiandibaonis]
MKKILVFLFAVLVLVACNHMGESSNQIKVDNTSLETEGIEKVKKKERKEPIVLEAYMPTNDLDIYGYVMVLIKIKNNSDEAIKIHQSDFILYDNESDTEFEILVDFGNYEATPKELTLAPNEENYTLGYYNISIERPDIFGAIDIEEFEMKYNGDTAVQDDIIALKVDFHDEYAGIINEITNSQEVETEITDENINLGSQQDLVISVYGPLDDREAYVRVQNTSSNEVIYYDSTKLYVYDDVNRYGIDPKVYDSAINEPMLLQPGQIVDYREFFLFENDYQSSVEIGGNIKTGKYVPKEDASAISVNYYHEGQLPQDFSDYD